MIDIRYLDLLPDYPIDDFATVPTIYADGIADMRAHGTNFTLTYFVWSTGLSGVPRRVPVARIIRPCQSLVGMKDSFTAMLRGGGASRLMLPH